MDALRIMAIERKVAIPDSRGAKFNRSFLRSVRRHGRLYELGMLMAYKLRSGDLLADVTKTPRMLAKRKISVLPASSGNTKAVQEVFRRAEQEDKDR
jgi:heterodisulfide reductase subunit C